MNTGKCHPKLKIIPLFSRLSVYNFILISLFIWNCPYNTDLICCHTIKTKCHELIVYIHCFCLLNHADILTIFGMCKRRLYNSENLLQFS